MWLKIISLQYLVGDKHIYKHKHFNMSTALTMMELMDVRREYCNKIAYYRQQKQIAKQKYNKTIKDHNRAVKKLNEKKAAPKEQKVSRSTLRRWARAIRHRDIEP